MSRSFKAPSYQQSRLGAEVMRSCHSRCSFLIGRERIAFVPPGKEASSQGPHLLDSLFSELQRRTGAGGLVGSGAVENHLLPGRNLSGPLLDFARRNADGVRQDSGVGQEVE